MHKSLVSDFWGHLSLLACCAASALSPCYLDAAVPTSGDASVQTIQGEIYTFSVSDFPYNDGDGDPLSKVRLQAATAGTLWYDADNDSTLNDGETAVSNGEEVLVADLGKLRFQSDLSASGSDYASFGFEVHDGSDYSSTTHTLSIDVVAQTLSNLSVLSGAASGTQVGLLHTPPLGQIIQVVAGQGYSMFVKSDGSLWAVGANTNGQLGTGTTDALAVPTQVVASGVTFVTTWKLHSAFIKDDGSLWTMGKGGQGQLGDGTQTDRHTPVQIEASGVVHVSVGEGQTLYVKEDGSAWGTGFNSFGQLGDGTNTDQASPVQIMAPGSNVIKISAGFAHGLILKSDGSVHSFGRNNQNQLGDGTQNDSNVPIQIVSSGAIAIATGEYNSLVIKDDGSYWAVGNNSNGKLGDGTSTKINSLTEILPAGSGFIDAATRTNHTLLLKSDGSVWATGNNNNGELGDGGTTDKSTPVQTISSGAVGIDAGYFHSLILKEDHSLWSHGKNDNGELVDGTTTPQLSPNEAIPAPTFTFVSGTGDTDNASFAITGNELTTAFTADKDTKDSYSVRIRATTQEGQTIEKSYGISILNNPPTISGPLEIAGPEDSSIFLAIPEFILTLAGSQIQGAIDTFSPNAQFNQPAGVVANAAGDIFVADYGNHRIRKISGGLVTTFAGQATGGTQDGTGTGAQFNNPAGMDIDATGNIYVADYGGHVIRKITPDGVVSTIAGRAATPGTDNGNLANASFNNPAAVAYDPARNLLYVSGYNSHLIRKIDLNLPDSDANYVTTHAGSGAPGFQDDNGTAAQFNGPWGLDLDSQGNLFVADYSNNRIRKVTPEGEVSTIIGSAFAQNVEGVGTNANVNAPWSVLAWDDSTLYVGDFQHISRVDLSNNQMTNVLGQAGQNTSIEGTFSTATNLNATALFRNGETILTLSQDLHVVREILFEKPFSVSDPDGDTLTANLSVTSGNLTVTPTGGASIVSGANSSPTFSIQGSVADLNGTLATLTYLGSDNFNGADSLTYSVTDGTDPTPDAVLAIQVNPVIDPPTADFSFDKDEIPESLNNGDFLGEFRMDGEIPQRPIISAGWAHTSLIKTDGSLWATGANDAGQLGLSNNTDQSSATFTSIMGVHSVANGGEHTLILKNDGSLWSTGRNTNGQLGDGTTTDKNAAVQIINSGVVAIAAGGQHSLYLNSHGAVFAMGANSDGQIGNGTLTDQTSPVLVVPSGAVGIAAGDKHSLFLMDDGSLWSTGRNIEGQLGDGTNASYTAPVKIMASGVASMAADNHTLVLKADGSLWAAGSNSTGQLGDGTTNNSNNFIQIQPTGVAKVFAGVNTSFFIKTDGTAWAMGANNDYQLGLGTNTTQNSPAQIPLVGVTEVASGDAFTVFLKNDGSTWGVGVNEVGPIGDGSTSNRTSPVEAESAGVGLSTYALVSGAGDTDNVLFTLTGTALAANQDAYTPGRTQYAIRVQMTDSSGGTITKELTIQPASSLVLQQTVSLPENQPSGTAVGKLDVIIPGFGDGSLASGANHTVLLKPDGSMHTTGMNFTGQLGDGTNTAQNSPQQIISSGVATVHAGDIHTAYLLADGSLWTVGANLNGQLGNGTTTDSSTPIQVEPSGVLKAFAGGSTTHYIKSDGSLWGMGKNDQGQLGDSATTEQTSPVQILASGASYVSASPEFIWILKTDSTLWTAGVNTSGQLGDGTNTDRSALTQVATDVSAIATGDAFGLFIKSDGSLWAVGDNTDGQLGNGNNTNQSTPVQIMPAGVVSIAVGGKHSLAVMDDGKLMGWGSNSNGQLGDGTTNSRNAPAQITPDVLGITAGFNNTLFLKTDGSLWATGSNTNGELGNGSNSDISTPVQVATGVGNVAFTLVAGEGDTHNSLFTISGAELSTAATLDYETGPYSIRLQAANTAGLTFTTTLEIQPTNGNDLTLDNLTVLEGQSAGAVVGNLTIARPTPPAIEPSQVGQKLWEFNAGGKVYTPPVLSREGILYFGSDTNNNFYAIDANNGGTMLWTYNGTALFEKAALGKDGKVYVGSGDNKLYALDAADGTKLWEFATTGPIVATPVLDGSGKVYVGSQDGTFYAVNTADGSQAWSFATGGPIQRGAALSASGILFFGSNDFKIYAVNATTGLEVWQKTSGGNIWSSPAIGADGTVYVGSRDSKLYALDPSDGSEVWTPYTAGNNIESSPAIGADGTIYVGSNDNKLHAINPADGTQKWTFTTSGIIRNAPTIGADGSIYFGSHDTFLYALDSSGNQLWNFQAGIFTVSSPTLAFDGMLFIGNQDNKLYALQTGTTPAHDAPWPTKGQNPYRTGRGYTTHELVSGTGDTDNANFTLSAAQLSTAAVLDFATQPSHSVRIQSILPDGETLEAPFTITVTQPNYAPEITAPPVVSGTENTVLAFNFAGEVSTLAGSSSSGFQDDSGAAALFNGPHRIVADAAGNFFVADYHNHRIRKVTSGGVVTTFAGNGSAATADGNGTSASFNNPQALAMDASGNLYVSEDTGNVIRKITPAGDVTTIAGSAGQAGDQTGTGANARFDRPYAMAINTGTSILYIGESNNHKIKKIDLTLLESDPGFVTEFAGSGVAGYQDGTGSGAQFRNPHDLAIDSVGNLYVADYSDHRIRKINPAGEATTIAGDGTGGSDDGTGTAAKLLNPLSLTIFDDNTLFFSDTNHLIRRVELNNNNEVVTFLGDGTSTAVDGDFATAKAFGMMGMLAHGNALYLSAAGAPSIRKIALPNGISVTDANGDNPTINFSVNNGTLSATLSGGATFTSGSNDSASFSIGGTQADVNATLASLAYQPEVDFVGTATLTYSATDGTDTTPDFTMQLEITVGNAAPVAMQSVVHIVEDTAYTFGAGDFPYTDANGDSLDKIRIQPVSIGTLWVDADSSGAVDNGEAVVAANDEVLLADIPKLKFLPVAGATGVNYATFLFDVHDGTAFSSSPATVYIDVLGIGLGNPSIAENSAAASLVDTFGALGVHERGRLAAGSNHSLFVRRDGSLWAVGSNANGQLGDGTNTDKNAPVQVLSSGVVDVVAGNSHSLFLKEDGSLWAMGLNSAGQLGDGTTTDSNVPVQVQSTGVKQIAADGAFSLYVKEDGSLWGMGVNGQGQLGTGNTTSQSTPVQIEASGVVAAGAGAAFTMYLKDTGAVWATGDNSMGQFGDGTTTSVTTPKEVIASGVQWFATGGYHSLFIYADGSLWATGRNEEGQLGNGNTTDQSSPVMVAPSSVAQVFGGRYHSLYIKQDRTLWLMGSNSTGQLGDGTTTDSSTPLQFGEGGIYQAAGGLGFTIFLQQNGSFQGMGTNANGQLGDGSNTTPSANVGVQLDAGRHTFALVAGAGDTDNGEFTITEDELTINAIPDYEAKASYDIRVRGTLFDGTVIEKAFTIGVTDVNEAPSGADKTLTATEDTALAIAEADFGYSDPENDPLITVRLQAPSLGILWMDYDADNLQGGQEPPLENGQDVSMSEISFLRYITAQDGNGVGYATFQFEVNDGTNYGTSNTITIDVTPSNDFPVGGDAYVQAQEDTAYSFSANDFPFFDVDGDALSKVRFQAASQGTFWLDADEDGTANEAAIASSDEVLAADLGKLKYLPVAGTTGKSHASILFEVHDGTVYSLASSAIHVDVAGIAISGSSIDENLSPGAPVGTLSLDGLSTNITIQPDELGTKVWEFATFGDVLSPPALSPDGIVYISSKDDKVYAINASTGLEVWSFTGTLDMEKPVLGNDGNLYVTSHDDKLYAFDAADGTKLWEFITGDDIVASVALDGAGKAYFGSFDGKVYAVNTADGTEAWSFTTRNRVHSTPALSLELGVLYIGSNDTKVYAVNLSDGSEAWQASTAGVVWASPAIGADGTVYVGSHDSKLYAFDGTDGTELWTFTAGNQANSSPTVGPDGTIYFGANDNKVYALNPNGTQKWTYTTGDKVRCPATVGADGNVYVGSMDGSLYALDGQTGTPLWSYATGDQISLSGPAIGPDGVLYIGSQDDKLYAIQTNTRTSLDCPWASRGKNNQRTSRAMPGFTFELVAGAGDTDNGEFVLNGNTLTLANPADFEAKPTYSIRLKVTPSYGPVVEKVFAISVNNQNDLPTSADHSILTPQDTAYVFSASDFPFTDEDSDTLAQLKLGAATAGTLWVDVDSNGLVNGGETPVPDNAVVDSKLIPKLTFLPDSGQGGVPYATFVFEVHDGTAYGAVQTMTVNVAQTDPPVASDNTVTASEDTAFTFAVGDFPFTDPDPGDTLQGVRLQAAAAGTLWVDSDSSGILDGAEAAVANNDTVALADIPKLSFLAAPEASGASYATFTFEVSDGILYSASPATMTVNVDAVNDPPVPTGSSILFLEDLAHTFEAADFPFTDIESDALVKLRFLAPAKGTLWVDTDDNGILDNGETAIGDNDEVPAAEIPILKYVNNLDENGGGYTTISYDVFDGTDYSVSPGSISVSVAAVNDVPVTADNTVTAIENTVFTFAQVDFPYTDPDSHFAKVRLQAISAGVLWVDADSSGALDNGETIVANNDEVLVADIPKLKFLADTDANGPAYATFVFEVHDGTAFSTPSTMTINVNAVNNAPVATPASVIATEDTPYAFSIGDFPFTDVESDSLVKLRLQAVGLGELWVDSDGNQALDNGEVAVANGDEVDAANVPKLSYLPALDGNGLAFTTFGFEIFDGTDYSIQTSMTINVSAVNDVPVPSGKTVEATEETVLALSAADFPFEDVETDPLVKVRLQAVDFGTLWLDTTTNGILDNDELAVANNDEVLAADLGKLRYLPPVDAFGIGFANFQFDVHDGTGYSTEPSFVTIDVTNVNDTPTTGDNSVTLDEDTVYAFTASDFPYNDVDTDDLAQVRLQAATAGSLWVDLDNDDMLDNIEEAVADGDEVLAANIPILKFAPAENGNGAPYATFQFEVHDGTVYSAPAILTINVNPVNDAPVSADALVKVTADEAYVFSTGDFPYTDIESEPLSKLRFQAATAGTFWLDSDDDGALGGSEFAIAANTEIPAGVLHLLKFLPAPGAPGGIYATAGFEVNDGTDYSVASHTLTIEIATILLDNDVIPENQLTGSLVGNLSIAGSAGGDTFALVAGAGDTDNAKFTVSGTQLLLAEDFGPPVNATYSIRIEGTRTDNTSSESTLSVQIRPHAPTALHVTANSVMESPVAGKTVGTLSVDDSDGGDSHTYTLHDNASYPDNLAFLISGDTLVTAIPLDYETKSTYLLQIQVMDSFGETYSQSLTIQVDNVAEPILPDNQVPEFHPAGTVVGILYPEPLDIPAQDIGQSLWDFTTGADILSSPAIGPDGKVYIGSADSKLYAFDGQSGVKLWEFTAGGIVQSTPAVSASGTVYVGADDNFLYALDGTSGAKHWEFEAGGKVRSSPAIGEDGKVYFGSDDFKVYALDGTDGTKVWEFATGNRVYSAPALGSDGTVYVGSYDNKVYALDGQTGAKLWEFATGGLILSSPAIDAAGVVYIGSNDFKVYALDGADGTKLWETATGGEVKASPAIGTDGTLYVGSFDDKLYALDSSTGSEKWSYATGGDVFSSPALGVDGSVYVGSHDGKLHVVDSVSGSPQWEIITGGTVWSSPVIGVDGKVYFGAWDDKVYAVQGSSRAAGSYWPMFGRSQMRHHSVHAGLVQYSIVAGDGGTDNDLFTIEGDRLLQAGDLSATGKKEFFVRINGVDEQGNLFEGSLLVDLLETLELDTNTILENQPADTVVGNFAMANSQDPVTYSLVAGEGDSGNAAFQFSGNVLQAVAPLDFEAQSQYSIRAKGVDSVGQEVEKVFTIHVQDANDLPVAQDLSLLASEDTPYPFSTAVFPVSDQDGDDLVKLRLQAVSKGTFWVDSNGNGLVDGGESAIANNDEVLAVDIPALRFLSNLNESGSGYATFGVEAFDGTAYSLPVVYTMDILAVNDVPVPFPKTLSTPEDTTLELGTGDFLFSDLEGDNIAKIRVQAPSAGSLWIDLDLSGAVDNGESVLGNGQEIAFSSIPALRYLPGLNGNGSAYASFQFEVHDGGGYSESSATITIDVTPVQDAPTSASQTVTTAEDTAHSFVLGDFLFFDVESDPFVQVMVESIPAGVLWLDVDGSGALDNGEVATTPNAILPSSLRDKLAYLPPANAHGSPYTQFTFSVSDGNAFSAPFEMTINVTPVADPPQSSGNSITATEDTAYTFQDGDFPYSDPDGDPLVSVWVFSLSDGTLWLDADGDGIVDGSETEVGSFDEIAAADLPDLKFRPAPNANGSGYATFAFQVNDGSSLSIPASTMTINVTAVNDPPLSANASLSAPSGLPLVFESTDFPFSDFDAGDTLAAVRFQPASVGTLWMDFDGSGAMDGSESPVASNQVVLTGNLPFLKYLAGAAASNNDSATFSFEVFDGLAFSSPQTFTIDLTGVNQAPVSADSSITALEDSPYVFQVSDFPYTDPDGNPLAQVTLGQVSSGTLWLDTNGSGMMDSGEVPLGFGAVVISVDLPKLTYLAPANANGSPLASVTFQVHDGLVPSSQQTLAIHVQAVNDLPISQDGTLEAAEGEASVIDIGNISYFDLEGSPLSMVRIQNLTVGTLWLDQDGDRLVDPIEPMLEGQQAGSLEIGTSGFQFLSFLPAPGESGIPYASFQYRVSDGMDYSQDFYTLTINVPDTNDPPVLDRIGNLATQEDTPLEIIPVTSDPDGDAVILSVQVNSGNLSATSVAGKVTFFPLQDWNGVASVTVFARDPKGSEVSETLVLSVISQDDAPQAIQPASVQSQENQPVGTVVAVLSTLDPDSGDSHTYTLAPALGNPDNAFFTLDGNHLMTATNLDFESKPSYSVVLESLDSTGLSLTQAVTVSVLDQAEPPSAIQVEFQEILQSMAVGSPIATFTALDQDAQDSATFSLVSDPSGQSFDNGRFLFDGNTLLAAETLDFTQYASLTVVVQAQDLQGNTLSQALAIQPQDTPGIFPPIVSTGSLLSQDGSYTVQGTILHNGNATILEKGVLYGTTSGLVYGAPDVLTASSHAAGSLDIESILANLLQGREYFYRAFAKNIQGIAYGQERSFTVPRQKEVSSVWSDATELGNNWYSQPGFGLVYVLTDWVYHTGLGWIYVVEDGDASGIWFWAEGIGWSWTTFDHFPYVWNHNAQAWLYYFETTATEHIFYNSTENRTEQYPLD